MRVHVERSKHVESTDLVGLVPLALGVDGVGTRIPSVLHIAQNRRELNELFVCLVLDGMEGGLRLALRVCVDMVRRGGDACVCVCVCPCAHEVNAEYAEYAESAESAEYIVCLVCF